MAHLSVTLPRPMRVLILGGDGYLGWPTALRFSARGHEVAVVDNFSRRRWHREHGTDSLTPIGELDERIDAWREASGEQIRRYVGAVEDGDFLDEVVAETRPEAVIHYGEQPSAPYSMIVARARRRDPAHNVIGTPQPALLDARPRPRLPPGQAGDDGRVRHSPTSTSRRATSRSSTRGARTRLPFPKLPGSLYHCSKVHDSTNIHFACRIWGLRATDLNQGVVYGIETEETGGDERLITRFDYDEIFGTVLNRFCVQAVIGHPLTVYGTGGQTRGFLNIRDTLQCVELAAADPGRGGEFRVFNQFTEQFSVLRAGRAGQARRASTSATRSRSSTVENPRVEKEEHYYNAIHTKLLDLGLEPTLLGEELVESIIHAIERYKGNVIESSIDPHTRWNPAGGAKTPAGQA